MTELVALLRAEQAPRLLEVVPTPTPEPAAVAPPPPEATNPEPAATLGHRADCVGCPDCQSGTWALHKNDDGVLEWRRIDRQRTKDMLTLMGQRRQPFTLSGGGWGDR